MDQVIRKCIIFCMHLYAVAMKEPIEFCFTSRGGVQYFFLGERGRVLGIGMTFNCGIQR